MARKIQIKRGNKANLPELDYGELALTMDEEGLYAGGAVGNIPVGGKAITPALIGAVNKTGDTMTNRLTLPSVAFTDDRISAVVLPEGSLPRLQFIVYDKATGSEGTLNISPESLVFMDSSYVERTVIHTGNLARYVGVATASLE